MSIVYFKLCPCIVLIMFFLFPFPSPKTSRLSSADFKKRFRASSSTRTTDSQPGTPPSSYANSLVALRSPAGQLGTSPPEVMEEAMEAHEFVR